MGWEGWREIELLTFSPDLPTLAARPGPARPSHLSRSEGVGWREIEILNVATDPLRAEPRASRTEAQSRGSTDPAGRVPAEPEGEKGALSQTRRVCRAASWGRCCADPRRQRPRPSRCDGSGGASRPPAPSRVDRAAVQLVPAPIGRSTWLGREAHTQYALPPATRVSRPSAAERRASPGPCEGKKDARRWAVPCDGRATQGTGPSLGASSGLKPCPRLAPAGRLDPASRAETWDGSGCCVAGPDLGAAICAEQDHLVGVALRLIPHARRAVGHPGHGQA